MFLVGWLVAGVNEPGREVWLTPFWVANVPENGHLGYPDRRDARTIATVTGRIEEFIGVYDADGTIVGEVSYWIGARLGRTHCSLCELTHGLFTAKREWRVTHRDYEWWSTRCGCEPGGNATKWQYQVPVKSGRRFSRKARIPSRWSADPLQRRTASRSTRRASSSGRCSAPTTALNTPATANGG